MEGNAEYLLSKYKEIEVIAETVKSKIFLVKDTVSGQLLIKKQLPLDSDIGIYKLLSAKDMKGLPRVHFVVSDDKYNYVFESYVSGSSLMNLLEKQKTFAPEQVIEWTLMLCDVLGALHGNDTPIIHRDIKPSNIIISDDGILKLIDFDIAREYKANAEADTAHIGTKKYAPPEQYGFSQTDCRSDIFSVGILMAELLTGNTPDYNQDFNSYGALGRVIKKCIAVDPKQRFQNVRELQLALGRVNRPLYNRVLVTAGIVAFICAVIGIFILYSQRGGLDLYNEPQNTPYRVYAENDSEPVEPYTDQYIAAQPQQNGADVDEPYELSEYAGGTPEEYEVESEQEFHQAEDAEAVSDSQQVQNNEQALIETTPPMVQDAPTEEPPLQDDAPDVSDNSFPNFLTEIGWHSRDAHDLIVNSPEFDYEMRAILGDMYDIFMQNMALSIVNDTMSFSELDRALIDGARAFGTHSRQARGVLRYHMVATESGSIYLVLQKEDERTYYFTNNPNRLYYIPPAIVRATQMNTRRVIFANASDRINFQQGENVFYNDNNVFTFFREGDDFTFELVATSPWTGETAVINGQATLDGGYARFRSATGAQFSTHLDFNFAGDYLTVTGSDGLPVFDFVRIRGAFYRRQN